MTLKLSPDVIFHHDISLMVYRPHGILTEERLRAIVGLLENAEDAADKPFHRFSDLSRLDAIDLDFKAMFSVSLHRRLTYATRPPVKSAFYVTSEALVRIVKLHALLTNHSPLKVKMFQELTDASNWLDVPPEVLVDPQHGE